LKTRFLSPGAIFIEEKLVGEGHGVAIAFDRRIRCSLSEHPHSVIVERHETEEARK